jgi:hypothetical protein
MTLLLMDGTASMIRVEAFQTSILSVFTSGSRVISLIPPFSTRDRSFQTQVHAKKSKRNPRETKGFGKQPPPVMEDAATASTGPDTSMSPTARSEAPANPSLPPKSTLLQSVEGGSSTGERVKDGEDAVPPEERAARILREKYGIKTLDEQQLDLKQQQAMKEKEKKFSEWKKKVESDQDFDVMTMLPAPVLRGIDVFLKAGVAVASVSFILSGIGITVEAWSKTTGSSIDPALDRLIVETIEPNFTAGLLVLLGFSVSLGLFAAAQLGSAGAQYKEDE